jgi:hypothetical protein
VAKGLTSDARQRLQSVIRDRVLPHFKTEKDAADAMSVDPSALNRLLKHDQGGSLEFAENVARFLGEPAAKILYGSDQPPEPTLSKAPGFEDAMAEARRRVAAEHPGIDEKQLNSVGAVIMSPPPEIVSAGLLIYLAMSMRAPAPKKSRR